MKKTAQFGNSHQVKIVRCFSDYFKFILKIFYFLLGCTKISRIFVKEITTKTNKNDNSN